jgi:hypothetical protein
MIAVLIIVFGWAGLIAGIVGAIWIAILAFQDEQPIWGVACFFCFIAALIYGIMRFDEAKVPLALVAIGFATKVVFQFLAAAMS